MKKITLIISLIGFLSLANATIISFSQLKLTDNLLGYYGHITNVTYQDGEKFGQTLEPGSEPLLDIGSWGQGGPISQGRLNMHISGGLGEDKLEIQHGSDILFEGIFTTDLTAYVPGTYSLTDAVFTNTKNSPAIDELAALYEKYPGNAVSFSFGGDGVSCDMNGQLASVPEPTTLGLLGMGLIGAAFFRRRKK